MAVTGWPRRRWPTPSFLPTTATYRISFPASHYLQERVGETHLRFNSVAENVAAAPDVDTAHTALMKSPGHRANILHQDYNAVGISIVERDHELFITQDFAHTLASYTEKQFRESVIATFNQARRYAETSSRRRNHRFPAEESGLLAGHAHR